MELGCSGGLVDDEEAAEGELDVGTGTWRGGQSGNKSGAALITSANASLAQFLRRRLELRAGEGRTVDRGRKIQILEFLFAGHVRKVLDVERTCLQNVQSATAATSNSARR